MPTVNETLAATLGGVQRPGDFYAAGSVEIHCPSLEVDGVGRIALPLLPVQAEQLVTVATPAPYGRGEQTLVDNDVRRTWQIEADKVRLGGRHWGDTLSSIVARTASGLGVDGAVQAELYKLLMYDQGSFFVEHRDTEKTAGMFATLVVVLPSEFDGGELVIRHQGREETLDLHTDDPADAAFAAFYADCVHEVLPVTSGCRLTLVYNLVRDGRDELPNPPDRHAEQDLVAELLRSWVAGNGDEPTGDDSPEKLVYPLEHAYTPAELGFDTLKNADAAVGATLVAAAEAADCELHLALVSIEESGIAEHYGGGDYGRYDRWDDSDDEYEIVEVCDSHASIDDWRRPNRSAPDLDTLPFTEDELCPPDAFQELAPDEQFFHEATGNEGASFERTYRQAVFVLWPRARRLAVLSQGGPAATLPWLLELTRSWTVDKSDADPDAWHVAHTVAGHILQDWPERDWERNQASERGETTVYLTCLALLRDQQLIEAFVETLAEQGPCRRDDAEALVDALIQLPAGRALDLLEAIVAHHAATATGACTHLLCHAAAAGFDGGPSRLEAAVTRLIDALPVDRPRSEPIDHYSANPIDVDLVVDLLIATAAVDEGLAERALGHLLAHPQTYGMDALLAPATLRLVEQSEIRDLPIVDRLKHRVIAHFQQRIAEPLEPPQDWRRDSRVTCDCTYCTDLSRFLATRDQGTWKLKAAEAERRHVEQSIQRDKCDVDCRTEKKGRPYTLVCNKYQASYLRRVEQRGQDLETLGRLATEPAT